MRDHSTHIQVSREHAVEALLDGLRAEGFRVRAQASRERVALTEAFGRVLAEDVVAKTDIPNTLTCRMDSIALHWDDFADLPAGEIPDTSGWKRGVDWQFANTGIAMPEGFDSAILIEYVDVSDDEQIIRIKAVPAERFAGTRQPGSTMRRGEVAVAAGCVITPDVAASISSAGHASVLVEGRPRVSFLPTGNELVPANLPFSSKAPDFYAGYGHVFESNSVLTKGKVLEWGGSFTAFDIIPDEYDAIKATILEAVATSDIVVLNAGSSKGSDDWSVEVLEEIGTMVYHQVAHGPGHHSFAAIVEGTPVVGISGPPGGVSFTLGFYLEPVIREWLGLDVAKPAVKARLKGSFGENKHGRKKQTAQVDANKRPDEAGLSSDPFCSVRFLRLEQEADGSVVAVPIEREGARKPGAGVVGIHLLASGPDDAYPAEGAIIDVEL